MQVVPGVHGGASKPVSAAASLLYEADQRADRAVRAVEGVQGVVRRKR